MSANAKRILKDTRPLFWPWCAMALAGALPLVYPMGWAPLILLIMFFAVPLLASLSLGKEFQHRTFSLLLSQPIGRMAIWGEKLSVTTVAVVSAMVAFSLALRATAFRLGAKELAFAAAWIVAIVASAPFWTLLARSTVGGVALNVAVQSTLGFMISWANLADPLRAHGYLAPGNFTVPSAAAFIFLCYIGFMLWLGGRMLARFQATGGMGGDDLLMAGPNVMPGAFAGWLRCRHTGVTLNLIRKELRMLRPVWLISLLAGVGWACLTLVGLLREGRPSTSLETAVVILGVVSTLMISILAGSFSLGEEKTSGTRSWQMTLPASALLQWRIKLYVALAAGLVGAGLLPVLIAGNLFARSHMFADLPLWSGWLLPVALLTFIAFWCACAVEDTVRAVLWTVPVLAVLGLARQAGLYAGPQFMHFLVPQLSPFFSFKLIQAVASHIGWVEYLWGFRGWSTPLLILVVLTTLLAVIQSYRMFRAPVRNAAVTVVRNLWPLAVVAFLCSFSVEALQSFILRAWGQEGTVLVETLDAIEKIQGASSSSAPQRLDLSVGDLAKASPLSADTRRWLHGAHVTVVPLLHRQLSAESSESPFWREFEARANRLATIYLPGGSDCTHVYPRSRRLNSKDVDMLFVICQ